MRHAKARKYEIGRNRPTENRASNVMLNEQVNDWINKIRESGKGIASVDAKIDRATDVLVSLIGLTMQGKVQREVVSCVVNRLGLTASLARAYVRIKRG
jgi:hypothetical protein